MQRNTTHAELLHISEAPRLRVSGTAPADGHGPHAVSFAGTMCTMTVPGAMEAITRWLARTEPAHLGVDLADVEFIDGRGVSLLVALRCQARALGIQWSIVDPGCRARDVLDVCELLESMGIESLPH